MEREVLELCEAARTAADAAASLDGGVEEIRCIQALNQLKELPITLQLLLSTQVGRRLRFLKNHPRNKIRAFASELLEKWRNRVIQEAENQNEKNKSLESKEPVEEAGETAMADHKKVRRRKVENEKCFESPAAKIRKN
ncbi:hypothetical protein LWI28_020391 [Acer negundo]|uniref:TFIIS N-terminal domain-containing protein n=1 Tax=Acer negundo TaxID=4023 RepID=A0AAD5IAC0_ACENE|nr:hypothetical protein LWI28_020391 [Acer negundo]KAK4836488.1 hypothetical protein QYF36_023754 [Acer negundo]